MLRFPYGETQGDTHPILCTAAVKSVLIVTALLQQKPWSDSRNAVRNANGGEAFQC